MMRRPPRSTQSRSSAASDVYKRQIHLAAAMERPIVAIYGPTDPARTGPYGMGKAIDGWVLRDVSSVTDHSRRTAPEAGMLRIRVEDVVGAALNLLAEADSERLEESSG